MGEVVYFKRLQRGTNIVFQILDAAYLHGDQWVQRVVVVTIETWNFIFAVFYFISDGSHDSPYSYNVLPSGSPRSRFMRVWVPGIGGLRSDWSVILAGILVPQFDVNCGKGKL